MRMVLDQSLVQEGEEGAGGRYAQSPSEQVVGVVDHGRSGSI